MLQYLLSEDFLIQDGTPIHLKLLTPFTFSFPLATQHVGSLQSPIRLLRNSPSPISELSVSPHYAISYMKADMSPFCTLDCLQFLQHSWPLMTHCVFLRGVYTWSPMENNHGRGWVNPGPFHLAPPGKRSHQHPPHPQRELSALSCFPLQPRPSTHHPLD